MLCTIITYLNISLDLSLSYALPTWETYRDSICEITLKHPYASDKISQSGNNTFEIESPKDISDPDSLSMTIQGTCLSEPIPITKEMFNLTLSSLKDNFKGVTHEDNAFNRTDPTGISKNLISITGMGDGGDLSKGNSILTAVKNNITYIIKLNATGDDGNSGFVNNYKYLEDNVLSSVNLTK